MLSNISPHLFVLLLLREDPLQRGVQRVGQQELRYLARSQRRQELKNLASRVGQDHDLDLTKRSTKPLILIFSVI